MGQYFLWANLDKGAYIDAGDFGCSVKENGYLGKDCTATNAVMTLLANEWKGDRIVLVGDYDRNENHIPLVEEAIGKYGDCIWDAAIESFENVARYFKGCQIEEIMEDDADRAEQCRIRTIDSFYVDSIETKSIRRYRFVYNHTKKEYFEIASADDEERWLNPLSYLLISAEYYVSSAYGHWIGDDIGVTNDPDEINNFGYKDMTDVYTLDYFDDQADKAKEERERIKNTSTIPFRFIKVKYIGDNRIQESYCSPNGFNIKKGDTVVIFAYAEYIAGQVVSVDEFLPRNYPKDPERLLKIYGILDENLSEKEKETELLKYYSDKEREFRIRYKARPDVIWRHHEHNREEIERSETCSCIYCMKSYKAADVKDWSKWHAYKSALCPKCGKMQVIGDASGLPVDDPEFIRSVNDLWFVDGIYKKNF